MKRVLVVGGFGFYGTKVAAALRENGFEVALGTRNPGGREDAVKVDLGQPETFAVFNQFDAVVNCSDSIKFTLLNKIYCFPKGL